MTKSPQQIGREIQEALGLPPEVVKRWKSAIASFKRAIAKLEAGYSDALFRTAVKARDKLDAEIWNATAHVPYLADRPAHLAPPIQAMEAERKDIVERTWKQAQERGRAANAQRDRAEIKRLDEELREQRRPYEWIKR